MSVPLRAVQRLAVDPAQNSEMPSAHSISPQCHLMTYAGEQPAWITRLSQLIAHATAIPCTVIGTSAKPGDEPQFVLGSLGCTTHRASASHSH